MPFRVLGSLEASRRDGVLVPLTSGRQRALLTRLLAAAGHPVPLPDLIDAAYGDAPVPTAKGSVQSHLSRLRTVLRNTGGELRSTSGGMRSTLPTTMSTRSGSRRRCWQGASATPRSAPGCWVTR